MHGKFLSSNTAFHRIFTCANSMKLSSLIFSLLPVYFTIETYDDVPTIEGGPFSSPYQFSQLHFHWGDNDSYGSEGLKIFLSLTHEIIFINGSYSLFKMRLTENIFPWSSTWFLLNRNIMI